MQLLLRFFIAGLLTFLFIGQSRAQPAETVEDLRVRVSKLENEVQELKALLMKQMQWRSEKESELETVKEQAKEQQDIIDEATVAYDEGEELEDMEEVPTGLFWGVKAQEFYDTGLSPHFSDPRAKPFLRKLGRNTFIGGYIDVAYRAEEGGKNGFSQKHFIPFIYSDISDRVKFASEIEFEYGGPDNNRDDGEVKIEFATLDFLLREEINLRAGILLAPLGKYNLVHDAPLQDLTDPPLVDRYIIPDTFSESGAGLFGTFRLSETSRVDYEIYAVNGFQGLTEDGTSNFNTSTGVRDGKGSEKGDFNGDPAVVGRVAYSPFLGLDIGGSFHTGSYDERNDNNMTIVALDTAYQRGPFELIGEFANAFIERDSFAKGSDVPDDLWGYYIEPRYHFMPDFLKDIGPSLFAEDSTFTGVIRWGQIDLDGSKRDRATLGVNYRYKEDTVFKLDYQINTERGKNSLKKNGSNALLFSVATYF